MLICSVFKHYVVLNKDFIGERLHTSFKTDISERNAQTHPLEKPSKEKKSKMAKFSLIFNT